LTDYINVYAIQAELSGPCSQENSTQEILPTNEGTLVRKYQKCGKPNCRCQQGSPHGPYYWRVFYDRETKKQHWKYIGKDGKK